MLKRSFSTEPDLQCINKPIFHYIPEAELVLCVTAAGRDAGQGVAQGRQMLPDVCVHVDVHARHLPLDVEQPFRIFILE